MSREILFKAKRKNWRELPKDEWWVEGLPFIQDLDGMEQVCIAHHSISANDYSEICGENKNWFQIDPETICQYTGLNDNTKWEQLSDDEKKEFLSKRNYKERRMNRKEDWNGKRIWENDILRQKTTKHFKKYNPMEWERYGVVKFGENDWRPGWAGGCSVGFYIEHIKSVSIKPKDYQMGHMQKGINQEDVLNPNYPMEVIGSIYDGGFAELIGGAE